MADLPPQLPTSLAPVAKPLSLIPVGLKEAALDSPTFRASAIHFSEQLDLIETWLQNYVRTAGRLANEVTGLESLINSYVSFVSVPVALSEAVIDHDYTTLALQRYSDGAKDFWTNTLKWMKKVESTVLEPIKGFIGIDLANLKLLRRNLDLTQRQFDGLLARFASQYKTKEASSLREDAFQLHEARKAYLKASMDFCTAAPQVKTALDKLLVKVFSNRWKEMKNSREALATSLDKWSGDMDRIRGWSKEMEGSERLFKEELQLARKQIEDTAEHAFRPSREIDDYAISTVPYIGSSAQAIGSPKRADSFTKAEKQGWLFQKGLVGKPARTVWTRKWFYVKNGIFGWLIQSPRGVEESEKTGVLLCGIRPMFQEDRRFCFEVKTNLTSFELQAETQKELMEWISAFENAKRKALENPASSDAVAAGAKSIDPAFAITPPIAPEFAVKNVEGSGSFDEPNIAGAMLSTPDLSAPGNLQSRASIDVTGRRPTGLEPESDSRRERIIQKLDLHRKSNASSTTAPGSIGGGGIASLISASHGSFALGAAAAAGSSSGLPTSQLGPNSDFRVLLNSQLPASSLAPTTLAAAPAATNLSRAAVMVNGDKGIGTGLASADDGGTPGGLMANLWGTNNWSYLNQMEHGEVVPDQLRPLETLPITKSPLVDAETMSLDGTVDTGATDLTVNDTDAGPQRIGHRKTASLSIDGTRLQRQQAGTEYPANYPLALKAQDAQFRMLIPQRSTQDHLVMVFRAAWAANDQQEFPGRVYVTTRDMYFYSNHMGLVLISNVRLASILEVTAAPGKDCDFVYVHLREGTRRDGASRLTVKVFLEPLRLLQRRLNYLVHNATESRDPPFEDVIKKLLHMDGGAKEDDDDQSVDSWEEVDVNTPIDARGGLSGRDIKAGLRIDGTLFADPTRKSTRQPTKFKLPAHPVEFAPSSFPHATASKEFDVTAKALFHVLFGDKSAVFQILYLESCAEKLVQSPWRTSDTGLPLREFRFATGNSSSGSAQKEVADYQCVDVLNDHLCYVITDRKVPWYLPFSQDFTLLTKIVITHVAKSRCRLAIYTKVDWSTTRLTLGKSLVSSQARHDLYVCALALMEVTSDQVNRLGVHNNSNSRKAVGIFGRIGEQKSIAQLSAADLPNVRVKHIRKLRPKTLTGLAAQSMRRAVVNIGTAVLGLLLQVLKLGWRIATANRLLVLALSLSLLYSLVITSKESWGWWRERRASRFMARMGVVPVPSMGREIWNSDLEEWITGTRGNFSLDGGQTEDGAALCALKFQSLLQSTTPSSGPHVFNTASNPSTSTSSSLSTQQTIHRLQQTRHRYGTYRHDLLVALGVVERMERETVSAEFESWAFGEVGWCGKVGRLVNSNGRGRGKKGGKGLEGLSPGLEEYCGSCRGVVGGG